MTSKRNLYQVVQRAATIAEMGRSSEEAVGMADAVLREIRNCVQDKDEKWKGRRGVFAVLHASASAAESGVNQLP
jgi:hypothetical protein